MGEALERSGGLLGLLTLLILAPDDPGVLDGQAAQVSDQERPLRYRK
ncbi:hypothetical protein [Conexibacter sp. DBS9H8]|nr:hypothetical protein [Conexibacter sp. DBS9H8]